MVILSEKNGFEALRLSKKTDADTEQSSSTKHYCYHVYVCITLDYYCIAGLDSLRCCKKMMGYHFTTPMKMLIKDLPGMYV